MALHYYSKCLQIQEKINGKGSSDTLSTLNSIGLLYYNQNDNSMALEYYLKCHEILEKETAKKKVKHNIDHALILSKIGNVY